jgi:hypothetical protein
MDPRDHIDEWTTELAIALMTASKKDLLEASECLICRASLLEAVPTSVDSRIECAYCGTPYDLSFPMGTSDSLELRSPYLDPNLLREVRKLWEESETKQNFERKVVELVSQWSKKSGE